MLSGNYLNHPVLRKAKRRTAGSDHFVVMACPETSNPRRDCGGSNAIIPVGLSNRCGWRFVR